MVVSGGRSKPRQQHFVDPTFCFGSARYIEVGVAFASGPFLTSHFETRACTASGALSHQSTRFSCNPSFLPHFQIFTSFLLTKPSRFRCSAGRCTLMTATVPWELCCP